MKNLQPRVINNMHAALPHLGSGGELSNGASLPASPSAFKLACGFRHHYHYW
jgi:hypothetical protein